MKKVFMISVVVICCVVGSSIFAKGAEQAFPNQNIVIIVPFEIGGTMDIPSRIIADPLREELKVSVLVENKPGASGSTGTAWAAKAKPDGYTLLGGTFANMVAAYFFLSKVPYETHRDFLPLAYVGESVSVLAVRPSSPWKTFEELIEDAKKNPGKVSFASVGLSSTPALNMEIIKSRTGAELNNIIYNSGGEGTVAVLGGHVDTIYAAYSVLKPYIEAGTLRPLVATKKIDTLPRVPTFMEKGFPNMIVNWIGFFAPANVPKDIYNKLLEAFEKALKNPETMGKLRALGFFPERKTPAEFSRQLKDEYNIVSEIVKVLKPVKKP